MLGNFSKIVAGKTGGFGFADGANNVFYIIVFENIARRKVFEDIFDDFVGADFADDIVELASKLGAVLLIFKKNVGTKSVVSTDMKFAGELADNAFQTLAHVRSTTFSKSDTEDILRVSVGVF